MKKKEDVSFFKIVIIVLFIVFAFILFLGSLPKKTTTASTLEPEPDFSELDKYNDIDFKSLKEKINEEIAKRQNDLKYFQEKRTSLEKKINNSVLVAKWLSVLSVIGYNLMIFSIYNCNIWPYGISVFLQWNEVLLIFTLFILFLISERHESIHKAFANLKLYIKQKNYAKWGIHEKTEAKLMKEIYYLEALLEVHPGIFENRAN